MSELVIPLVRLIGVLPTQNLLSATPAINIGPMSDHVLNALNQRLDELRSKLADALNAANVVAK